MSVPLQISAVLMLKNMNKHPLSSKRPHLEKGRFGTRFFDIPDVYGVLFMNVTFVIEQNELSSKPYRFASHFLDRNIRESRQVLHFINLLVELSSQSPASCCCLKSFWNYEAIFKFPASSSFNLRLIILKSSYKCKHQELKFSGYMSNQLATLLYECSNRIFITLFSLLSVVFPTHSPFPWVLATTQFKLMF